MTTNDARGGGAQFQPDGSSGRLAGPAPNGASYSTFAMFSDVDASVAHGEHEKRIGASGPDWPDWYAAYMVAERAGARLPQ